MVMDSEIGLIDRTQETDEDTKESITILFFLMFYKTM